MDYASNYLYRKPKMTKKKKIEKPIQYQADTIQR